MRIALDTNVIAYALGIDDSDRQSRANDIVDAIPAKEIVLPAQVVAELFQVLTRKAGLSREESALVSLQWASRYAVHETSKTVTMQSLVLAARHHFTIWDAIVLNSAIESECRMLLSEDMQHDFTWSGVTIVNPFRTPMHPLLDRALRP